MARSLAEELFGPEGELTKTADSMPKKKVAKTTGDMGLLDDEEKVAKREKRKKKLLKAIEKW